MATIATQIGVTIEFQNGMADKVSAKKTANYTALTTDYIVYCDTTAGAFTVTLPATPAFNQEIIVVNDPGGANSVTVDGNGHNIDGASTKGTSNGYGKLWLIWISAASVWSIMNNVN